MYITEEQALKRFPELRELADSPIAKTHRDLGGLLYADGIHDSLYRTAGKQHTAFRRPVPHPRPAAAIPAITGGSGDPAAVVA